MRHFPIMLDLAGRLILVVGGGQIATRRVEGLLRAGARVRVVTIEACEELRTMAEERSELDLHVRPYREDDLAGAALVFSATGDPVLQKEIAASATARGLWVNAADDPEHCSFLMPAILEHGPLTVSVSSGGESPALAVRTRDAIGQHLGPEYIAAAELLAQLRRELPAGESRMQALMALLDQGLLEALREEDSSHVEKLVEEARREVSHACRPQESA